MIISYPLATKLWPQIAKRQFQAIIADEAHALKSRDSQRSKNLIPILSEAKRVILISGTPVLARPVETYNLLKIIRPDLCPTFNSFAARYCAPKKTRYGMDYSGSACTLELHCLLESCFMVRRLKRDVLDQLPDKRRQ